MEDFRALILGIKGAVVMQGNEEERLETPGCLDALLGAGAFPFQAGQQGKTAPKFDQALQPAGKVHVQLLFQRVTPFKAPVLTAVTRVEEN
jgi:hypothetical protein